MGKYAKILIKTVAKRLREMGRKPAWLAEQAGLSKSVISELMSEKRVPKLDTIVAIATALEMSPSELIDDRPRVEQSPESDTYDLEAEALRALIVHIREENERLNRLLNLRFEHDTSAQEVLLVLTKIPADLRLVVLSILFQDPKYFEDLPAAKREALAALVQASFPQAKLGRSR